MKIGLLLPQGYFDEFEGWQPVAAWERILEIAQLGERLGFDTLWAGEHTLSKWDPEGMVFDGLTLHTAVAAAVPRVDIGFGVINSTFRNPAMTAKMASTLDTISGGRLILGLGCGFKPSEATAFGVPIRMVKHVSDMADAEAMRSWTSTVDECSRALAVWLATSYFPRTG